MQGAARVGRDAETPPLRTPSLSSPVHPLVVSHRATRGVLAVQGQGLQLTQSTGSGVAPGVDEGLEWGAGGRRGRRAGRCPPHTPQQKAHPQPRAWIQDLSPDASIASASACSLPATASGMLRRGAVPGRAHEVTGLGRRVVGLLLSGTPPSPAPH